MRATVMHAARDVRVEDVPDATLREPTDALIRVARACICGSDLWPYTGADSRGWPLPMGHEAIGVVEAVGSEVRTLKKGDLVVMPFAFSDGTCAFCHEGLPTACRHGGFFGSPEVGGAQAEALRVPQADGTLFPIPVGEDDALMPSLLTLSDVMGTGHHAAVVAKAGPGKTAAVIGDGAVGRVGVPHCEATPLAQPSFFRNVTVGGGPAPVRACIADLLPDVMEGRITPGRVFDRTVGLDGVPDGYQALNERESIKVMVKP